MIDAAAANGRVLRVMENYLFYEPLRRLKDDRRVGRARRGQRLPPQDGGQRPRRLGRAGEQLRVAVPADARGPRDPRVRRRLAQARDRALALRSDQGGAGLDRRDRGGARGGDRRADDDRVGARERHPRRVGHHARGRHVPALRLLHQRRAVGGHGPTWVRPGQSLHRPGDPAAEPRGLRRRRDARVSTPSTTTGPAASATRAGTGCGGSTPAMGRCCGAREEAVDVLRFALAAYASSAAGGVGVDPASLG